MTKEVIKNILADTKSSAETKIAAIEDYLRQRENRDVSELIKRSQPKIGDRIDLTDELNLPPKTSNLTDVIKAHAQSRADKVIEENPFMKMIKEQDEKELEICNKIKSFFDGMRLNQYQRIIERVDYIVKSEITLGEKN